MPIDIDKFNRLKATVEAAQRDRDRAQGAFDQLMQRLRDEFGCATLKEAKAKTLVMAEEAEEAERGFNEKLAEFEEQWKELLDGQGEEPTGTG